MRTILSFIFLGLISLMGFSQDKKPTPLKNVTVGVKNLTPKKRLKKALKNIESNYQKNQTRSFDVFHLATQDNDSVIFFDGVLKFLIPQYDSWSKGFLNEATVCSNHSTSQLEKNIFKTLSPYSTFEDRINMKIHSFFLGEAISVYFIKESPFIKKIKHYEISYVDINENIFELHFRLKKPFKRVNWIDKIPFVAKITVNHEDYAILNIEYHNQEKSKMEIIYITNHKEQEELYESYDVEQYSVKINYIKDNEKNLYELSNIELKSVFSGLYNSKNPTKETILKNYTTTTLLKNIKEPVDCSEKKIPPDDLGLFFDEDNQRLY